ncbi:hypothetical protein C6499_02005 [Candidatus Poribacteria bacterium]|nr:MAG: hypothetical protein C6499_02005 [Candidatus Poribacteria bacterium]
MEHSSFSQILLGLDGSPHAQAATEYACQIALAHNAPITGVAIIDQPGIQSSSGPVPIGGAHYDVKLEDQLLEETQAEAKAILDDFAHSLVTRSGHPDTVVKSYIAENDIDMLVMGAYGRRSVREFFVGSVTYHLIHETEIPLFLYH